MHSYLKKQPLVIALIILIIVICFPYSYVFYKLKPTLSISSSIKQELLVLGSKSLKKLDVPVGAIIIYNDSIIGRGYNTVLKDTVAFGHAEINAITSCLKKIGIENFKALDRNKLCLYTSLEPCEMCKGALIEYRIKKVYFMKSKKMMYWYKERNWEWVYEYNKTKIEGDNLQNALLKNHPLYFEE